MYDTACSEVVVLSGTFLDSVHCSAEIASQSSGGYSCVKGGGSSLQFSRSRRFGQTPTVWLCLTLQPHNHAGPIIGSKLTLMGMKISHNGPSAPLYVTEDAS